VDLVGGYYDAGDNVKFGLPMAFTVTMMSWSVLEYGEQMAAAGELGHALEAVKWGTDYFVKAHPEAEVLYGEVGWSPATPPAASPRSAGWLPHVPLLLSTPLECAAPYLHGCMDMQQPLAFTTFFTWSDRGR
jgi:hypothetical protein